MDADPARLLFRIIGVALLTGFIPLSAYSFFRHRLPKKIGEYNKIAHALGLRGQIRKPDIAGELADYRSVDYVIPVILAMAVVLAGSLVVVFGEDFPFSEDRPTLLFSGLCDKWTKDCWLSSLLIVSMAILGAYIWSVQTILRRLSTIDLHPRMYYAVAIRIILGVFIAIVCAYFSRVVPGSTPEKLMPALAFLIGMFPEPAIHHMKTYFSALKEGDEAEGLPLSMIQGMNLFYRIRLGEIGIDNAQNLACADLAETLVRTPFSPMLLIDWIGQAKLYKQFGADIEKVRKAGIHTIYEYVAIAGSPGEIDKVAKLSGLEADRLRIVYEAVKLDPDIQQLANARSILASAATTAEKP